MSGDQTDLDDRIVCRARQSKNCYHGKHVETIYGEDGSMGDDGTFDGKSVICDACYIAGGQPALPFGSASHSEVLEHVNREMGIDK